MTRKRQVWRDFRVTAILEALEDRRLLSAVVSTPFRGTPFLPNQTIEAENYDLGGEGVAYHDTTPANRGGAKYRPGDAVDVQAGGSNGYDVGYAVATEWLDYTINIPQAGTYTLAAQVANIAAGGTFHAEFTGAGLSAANLTGTMTAPNTGNWQVYRTISSGSFSLPAGQMVMRIVLDHNAASYAVANFDYFKLVPVGMPAAGPFHGVPFNVGQTIEAEDYDLGGEGVAYHDTTPANRGGAKYRPGDAVDVQAGGSNGYDVGYAVATEWLDYTISVPQAGTYALQAQVANIAAGGTFHADFGATGISSASLSSANLTGSIAVPDTGNWQTYRTVTSNSFSLPAGTLVMRIALDHNASSYAVANFDYFKLIKVTPTPPPPPMPTPTPGGTFAWSNAASAPQALSEAMGISVGGELYTFGGFNVTTPSYLATTAAQVFDPAANTWKAIAPLPSPLTHSGVATDGRYIYVAGGYVSNLTTDQQTFGTTNVWRYDTQANTWSAFVSLPQARGAGALVLVGRQLHFLGGVDVARNEKTDHWVLNLDDPAAGWETATSTPGPRNHLGAVALNGKIYIVGGQIGQDEQAVPMSSVYVYDPNQDPLLNPSAAGANPWTPGPSLPAARGHLTQSTFVWDGQIVVAGGEDANHNPCNTVWILDPAAGGWAVLPSLPGARGEPVAQAVGDTLVVTTGSFYSNAWTAVLRNHWSVAAPMPYVTGEVAGGIVNGVMYLNSGSHSYAYHIATNTWTYFAQPPVLLNHEAAEVFDGKIYYFGGLYENTSTPNNPWRGTSAVQIYDPATNTWSRGADIPFTTGSVATALIGGKIYLAGGIGADGYTHNSAAVYDPIANTWTMIADEPYGRNHTGAGTDGSLFYIFGGRGPGNGSQNTTTNGFNTVQIYNPATNSWITSLDTTGPGALLAPLPQYRGGMGKAVFYNGEFYVMGGETLDGPNATPQHTYNRVDIYNPTTNTWRLGAPMITGRHGIFPLLYGDQIYVAGGGAIGGDGDTGINEVYTLG